MVLYPNVGALALAQAALIGFNDCQIRLYKEISQPLSPSTVLGDFTQCDFSGYTFQEVADPNVPYLDPAGGASFSLPANQWNWVTPTPPALPVGNVVLGFYVVSSANVLLSAGNFDAPVAMGAVGDALPLQCIFNFCRN